MTTPICDYDYSLKKAELDRFCTDEKVNPELREIVRFLGSKTLTDPGYRASAKDICLGVDRIRPTDCLTDSDESWIKAHLYKARHERLRTFYDKPDSRGRPFRICLPFAREQESFETGRAFVLQFLDQRNDLESEDHVTAFWQRMVHGIDKVREAVLVYDTPEFRFDNPALNEPGAWAGSGEVAAACLVTQSVSRLQPFIRIDPMRWRDVGRLDNLTQPSRCLIILGSSINNIGMKQLREREYLRRRQTFHFEEAFPDTCKHGFIRKGSLAAEDGDKFECIQGTNRKPAMEFALVSYFRDSYHKQTLIALQGITTIGTHAAAKFMCTKQGSVALEAAFKASGVSYEERLPSFEMLLQLNVENGNCLGDIDICELIPHNETTN